MDRDLISIMPLCSGGSGCELGLGFVLEFARVVCRVEWEAFAAEVLASRMEQGLLDSSPLWSDLRTFDGQPWRGVVDIITAGYPCQPFSVAGRKRGRNDPRHLWPEVRRVIGEVQPAICFLENVPGHVRLGLDEVILDLEGLGYDVEAGLFAAKDVGTPHRRERLFILAVLADANRIRLEGSWHAAAWPGAAREGRQPAHQGGSLFPPAFDDDLSWSRVLRDQAAPGSAFAPVCDLAHGDAADRLRKQWLHLLGNGVVPLQAAYAFCSLWALLRPHGKIS